MTKQEELIKKTAEDLLDKMTFEKASVEVKQQEGSPFLVVSIQLDDPSQFIGESGANLNDFQRILRLVIAKKDPEIPSLLVDVNGYRERREEFLKELSREIAEQVIQSQKSVMLQPMSSYERRIIHVELSEKQGVATESVGEEPERRIVIKPSV